MKKTDYIKIRQKDGYITRLTYLSCQNKPKATILILHGMAEHHNRYLPFSQYLLDSGFDVYLYDHRGHGTDKKLSELGFFGCNKGYQLVIDDATEVSKYIDKNKRSDKFILFAHGMGSLIARNVILSYDKYNGIILSGTAYPPKYHIFFGLFITSLINLVKGPKYYSPFLNNLFFENKTYTSLSDRTAFDWLSRSHSVIGAYIHDPYCGFVCTASLYHDLMKLTANAADIDLIKLTPKNMPMFIISGEKDPVGSFGKDIKRLSSLYEKFGFTDITCKIYPGCRHELINELNRKEVFDDIRSWILKICSK